MAQKLNDFRLINGVQWKRKLKELILNSRETEPFQRQFRNRFDFDILDKIKFSTSIEDIELILNKYT